MEIKKENIVNAYQNGDESVKKMLRTMFPNIEFETTQAQTQTDKATEVHRGRMAVVSVVLLVHGGRGEGKGRRVEAKPHCDCNRRL